jgi:hypothetical protein
MAPQRERCQDLATMIDQLGNCMRAGLTLALGWTLVGCGATGLAWVDEPETPSGWAGPEQRSLANTPVSRASSALIPARTEAEPAPENHQRLNHTVTLGEVDVAPPGEQAPSPYGGQPVSVTINNYGQAGASTPGYAGYYSGFAGFGGGFARSGGAVTPASRPSSSSMQPGQNWPAVPDHGSSFPYRSAPASPWSGDGRRR